MKRQRKRKARSRDKSGIRALLKLFEIINEPETERKITMATRPANVPEGATLIYPGQTYGPGVGVQQATLTQINAIIARQNASAMQHYANAYRDWATNAAIYESLGMPVPPAPAKPKLDTLEVVYADIGGNVVPPPEGADGLHYAWCWQVSA